MDAPGMIPPDASLTMPVTAAVVTPCAAKGPADIASANSAPIAHAKRDPVPRSIASSCLCGGFERANILPRRERQPYDEKGRQELPDGPSIRTIQTVVASKTPLHLWRLA